MTIADKSLSKRAQGRLNQLKVVAYHEAGHAVVAIGLGRVFTSVSIISTHESHGVTRFEPPPNWYDPVGKIDDRHRLFIEREVLIELAGDAAVLRFKGRRNWLGARSDNESAVDQASYLFGGKVLQAYMAFMRERALATVVAEHCWIQIEALAATLVEERELTGDRAREVCLGALMAVGNALPGDDTGPVSVGEHDRVAALADFLVDQFHPETFVQKSYLVDRAHEVVARIKNELPRE
jgi:hypothetical protein